MGSLTSAVNLAHINGTTQAASCGHLQQIAKRSAEACPSTCAATTDVRYFAYGTPRIGDPAGLPPVARSRAAPR